jgi:phosphoglycolate phosphatase
MAAKLKAVIFDLDGTLVDAYKAVERSMNYALKQAGFPKVSAHTIKRSVGWGDRQLIEGFVGREHSPVVLDIYRRHHTESLKTGVKFLRGAQEILIDLDRDGYILAIASNRPTRFTKIILKILKMDAYFDCVLCADKISRPKPYPDILKFILKKYKLRSKEALYVGDMTIDVKTGNSARVKTVAVLTGSSTREEISLLKPYKIIPRISHLRNVIKHIESTNKKGN